PPALGMDDAVAVAKARYPRAEVIGIGLPTGPRGVFRVSLREEGDTASRPVTVVFVDPRSRAILQTADRASRTAGDRFLAWQRPVHEGSIGGEAWRAIVFAGGLLPALLMTTGLLMWLATRRRKRGLRAHATATADVAAN
ncbi:MAG TPA: PepSY-associated TM helix domain-containing protein, partial [Casimicrobiaceae bacterium]|nr:PepSY-associated TM helix domain-containing protein [Casimicrobiaceae bacterium]